MNTNTTKVLYGAIGLVFILAVAAAYMYGVRSEEKKGEQGMVDVFLSSAAARCSDSSITAVAFSPSLRTMRTTSRALGGGVSYLTLGASQLVQCPVVGPDSQSEECKAYITVSDWQVLCDNAASQESVDTGPLSESAAENVVREFVDAVLASMPPAGDETALEPARALLSARAAAELATSSGSGAFASMLGVQDTPDRGMRVDGIELTGEQMATVHATFMYSGGEAQRDVMLVAEDGVWKIDSIAAPEAKPTFETTGVLIRNNPGLPAGVWHVSYERPGAAALTKALTFTEASICAVGVENSTCDPATLVAGTRVRVLGDLLEDDVVRIMRLEIGE